MKMPTLPAVDACDDEWRAFSAQRCDELIPYLAEFILDRFNYKARYVQQRLWRSFGTVSAFTRQYDLYFRMFLKPQEFWPREGLVLARIGFKQQRVGHGRALVELLVDLAPKDSKQSRRQDGLLASTTSMKPTHFIEFEVSGVAPDSYPIEVAVVFPSGEYQALIQTASYWDHWSYDAQDMHGLSREQLISEGQSPLEVAKAMSRLFDGKILCSDNPADCYWLDALYEAAGIEPTFGVRPLETFIGREPATKALALRPAFRDHALGDVRALEASVSHYLQEGSRSLEE